MSNLEYLDEERKKLWGKIVSLEEDVNKKTSDYEQEARQSSKKASEFRNRSEEAKNTISQILDESNNKIEEIKSVYRSTTELFDKVKELYDSSLSTINNINDFNADVETQRGLIQENADTLSELFAKHDEFIGKIKILESIYVKGDEYSIKIDSLYKSVLNRKKEIDQLYYEIMGYTETDENTKEETEIVGLKDELEESYTEIKSKVSNLEKDLNNLKAKSLADYGAFSSKKETEYQEIYKNWNADFISVKKEVERLLPDALTAGLSSAYSNKKNDEEKESIILSTRFNRSIYGLVCVSLIPFAVSIQALLTNVALNEVILRMPRLVLSILPLYIPVMWIAYSSNKKLNLSKRLIEEYTHKEVLSKTFEGLSKQIANVDDPEISKDLMNRLLYNILEVSSENPGKLISDYNKSDHPLMDALDKSVKLASAVEKLSKIPGMTKLTSVLDKKSKEILKDKSEKAEAGLDDLENTKIKDED